MKYNRVLIAGMLISQFATLPAFAELSAAQVCATLKKLGVKSSIFKCDTSSSESSGSHTVASPPAPANSSGSMAHGATTNSIDEGEKKEIESPKGEDLDSADEVLTLANKPPEVELDLDPGEFGPENLAGISFGFMHTKQFCAVKNPETGFTHKETYCNREDQKNAEIKSEMVKTIRNQLDSVKGNANARVTVAYFSFSNQGVQEKICEISASGVPVRIFLDGGSAGQIDKAILSNPACKGANGKLNVKLSYLGGSTDGGPGGIWRLHHNKFLMIDAGDSSDVKLNFSSGNLSSFGTSLHLDHWVTIEAPARTNLIKAQKCVVEGLEKAASIHDNGGGFSDPKSEDAAIARAYIDTRENCFDKNNILPRANAGNLQTQIDSILQREQIAPLFSPNDDAYVEKAFITAIGRIPSNGYLYIAIQHFLHGGVANALLKASQRGVDVRLIMDDDALRGESEVPGVDKMINNLIADSDKKIQIRFAETNHNAGGNGAMMHNKLAILNGKMSFSGAGHYTNAALRKNWENFYFVTNNTVLSSYAQYFNYLWGQSVDIAYTKSKGTTASSAPSKLSSSFLKLAE